MTGDDFDLLVSRWLAGEASAEDEAQLAEQLRAGEDARLRFAELADQEAALRIFSQSMVQARQVREQESDTTRRIRTLARRRRMRGSESPWHASWVAGAAAAALFFVLVLAGAFSSPKPHGPVPKPTPGEAFVRVPDEAPPNSADAERAQRLRDRLDRLNREREKLRAPVSLPPPEPDAEPRPEPPDRPESERPVPERAPDPVPVVKPVDATRAVVATLTAVGGEVYVVSAAGRVPAQKGMGLLPGQGVETVGAAGAASFAYPDGTRVDLLGDSAAEGVFDREPSKGKRLRLVRGGLVAFVAKQPADQQMVFATPHSEAKVLGTTLRLVVGDESTRLEVVEGKVRLTSARRGKTVEVVTGHSVVDAVGIDLVPRIDEIFLLPAPGVTKIYGPEWHRKKDPRALSGVALDVPYRLSVADCDARFKKKQLGYVEFSFQADAGRDYHLWIRGCCMVDAPKVEDRWGMDMVAIEVPHARVPNGLPWCLNGIAYGYTGWAHRSGYWWIGGNADPIAPGLEPDEGMPMTFRFERPGRQVLRMYVYEAPLRIDSIWLSTTQKTRPDSNARGPGK